MGEMNGIPESCLSAQPSPDCCRHLQSQPGARIFCLFAYLSLSLYLSGFSFQVSFFSNKNNEAKFEKRDMYTLRNSFRLFNIIRIPTTVTLFQLHYNIEGQPS